MTGSCSRGVDRPGEIAFNGRMANVLEVGLTGRAYPIHIGGEVLGGVPAAVAELKAQNRPVALLADAEVALLHRLAFDRVFADVPTCILPGGEATKSLAALGQVYDFLAGMGMDRTGTLFVAGGGVIGDLGGFAAATFLRGIDFHQIPTTLLAMVDSSVGGKTGININAGKNLVGSFHQPRAVHISTDFLKTLPAREFNAGMAEVIKYGLLADAGLFERLQQASWSAENPDLPAILYRCCQIKAEIVSEDEREQAASGGRALLNLGHTFAHAIEQAAGYGEYLHGEAVGLGLVMAADYSRQLGTLSAADAEAVRQLVDATGLPVRLRSPLPADALLAAMKRDKKVRAGNLRLVTLERIGRAVTTEGADESRLRALWHSYGAQ